MTIVHFVDCSVPNLREPRDLPEQDAHDLVMAGRATLSPQQPEPPWIFLKEVKQALRSIDRVGPPATSEELRLVSNLLLPANVRQTSLNGMHVAWEHSSSRGEVAFRKALTGPKGRAPGLSRQIGEVLSYRLDRKKPVTLETQPSEAEIAAIGIIEVPDDEEAEWAGEWRCYEIGPDWLKFCKDWRATADALDEALADAIRDGRVLIVEELFPGGRLLHPERWANETYDPTDHANDWFLLTRDLPNEWFEIKAKTPAKRGRPKGSGGYGPADAPFVDLIHEKLAEDADATVHGVVAEVVLQYPHEIQGASHEAKVRRLMGRIEKTRA